MLREGDRVMVCVSGGKDSSIMLALLKEIQAKAPFGFELFPVLLDQGHPGFNPTDFSQWVSSLGLNLEVISKDTYSIVKEKVTSGVFCSLCSRLRRGILYEHANQKKYTKLALGHHLNDLAETLLMNVFYSGQLAAMPPKLKSDDGKNILIRPLSFVSEDLLIELQSAWKFPVIPCNLCGSQDGMKRKKVKKLLSDLKTEIPEIESSILGALGNVKASQLLDQNLWSFKDLDQNSILL